MKPSSVIINLRLISARHFLNTNKNANNLIPQETQFGDSFTFPSEQSIAIFEAVAINTEGT
jgi:hypothetical protein